MPIVDERDRDREQHGPERRRRGDEQLEHAEPALPLDRVGRVDRRDRPDPHHRRAERREQERLRLGAGPEHEVGERRVDERPDRRRHHRERVPREMLEVEERRPSQTTRREAAHARHELDVGVLERRLARGDAADRAPSQLRRGSRASARRPAPSGRSAAASAPAPRRRRRARRGSCSIRRSDASSIPKTSTSTTPLCSTPAFSCCGVPCATISPFAITAIRSQSESASNM